jgi:hypothetical protein
VTNKARFIAQILDNECPARVYEDLDEKVLTYAEIQAIAAGNSDIKERINTTNKLAELHMLKREWGYEKSKMRECLEVYPAKLEETKALLEKIQADKEAVSKINTEKLPFSNEMILAEINRAAANYKKGDTAPVSVGTLGDNFKIAVVAEEKTKGMALETETVVRFLVKGNSEYSHEAGIGENYDNASRLKNLFNNVITVHEKNASEEIKRLAENIKQAKSQIDIPFEYEAEIAKLEAELEEIDARLSGITEQQDVTADPDETELVETAEEKSEREKIYSADDGDYQPVPDDDTPDPPEPPRGKTR